MRKWQEQACLLSFQWRLPFHPGGIPGLFWRLLGQRISSLKCDTMVKPHCLSLCEKGSKSHFNWILRHHSKFSHSPRRAIQIFSNMHSKKNLGAETEASEVRKMEGFRLPLAPIPAAMSFAVSGKTIFPLWEFEWSIFSCEELFPFMSEPP